MSARIYRGPFGDTLRWIAGSDETDGAYAMLERVAPPGSVSPPHSHGRREAFYVLEGALTFTIDGVEHAAGAGTYLAAADGVAHGWRVEGDREARVLVVFSPAIEEAFFAEMDAMVRAGGPPKPAETAQLMARHGWQ